MAEKTVYYALTTGSGFVPANVFTTIGSGVLYIPENSVNGSPVTFSSVIGENYFRDITTATGNTINRTHGAIVVNGVKTSVSESNALTNTGENIGGIFGPINLLAPFTTSLGLSQSVSWSAEHYYTQSGGTTTGMNACSTLLSLTYKYNTSAPTQSKSVIIPIHTASSATTMAGIGTAANSVYGIIPILSGSANNYLVEASPIIDDYFIVLEGINNAQPAATNFGLTASIDGGTNRLLSTHIGSLQSDLWTREIIKFPLESIPALNTTHSFNLWSTLATRMHCVTAKLYITYRYNAPETTRWLNSYQIPITFNSPLSGGSAASSGSSFIIQQNLLNPTSNSTLLNSAIEMQFVSPSSPNISVRAISQSANRIYTWTGTLPCGQYQFSHPLNTGSYNAFPTFSSGENPFFVEFYRAGANNISSGTGYIYLNYVSDTSSFGLHTHPKTTTRLIRSMSYATVQDFSIAYQPNFIDEITGSSSWYMMSMNTGLSYWLSIAVNILNMNISVAASESLNPYFSQNLAGQGRGQLNILKDVYLAQNEICYNKQVTNNIFFKKYVNEPYKLHPTGSRRYTLYSGTALRFGQILTNTYHQITSSIGGTINGSGGGSIRLELFDNLTDTVYNVTTRTGNGTYTFDVYNPYDSYYVVAYEDNTYKGRSKTSTPAQNFDINLSSTEGSYTEYWF